MNNIFNKIKEIFGDIENDRRKRTLAIYFFTSFGFLSLTVFGIEGIIKGNYAYSGIILIFWIVTVATMLFLKLTKKVEIAAFSITTLFFIFELAILINLGKNGTGIYWFYIFPLIAIFMLGNKKGTIFSILLVIVAVLAIKFPNEMFKNTYDTRIIGRFVFIYFIALGLVSVFEYMRVSARKAFIRASEKLKSTNEELLQNNEEMLTINNDLQKKQIEIEQQKEELEEKNKKVLFINNDLLLQKAFIEEQSIKIQTSNEETQAINEELRQQQEETLAINNDLQAKQNIIKKQNSELEQTLEIVTTQQEKINLINKKVKDSINYARSIQQALLAQKELLDSLFQEYFIFYKPKETVSGDFYYANKVEDYIIFAVADCTGHGVPGGFLTMLGITYLHGAIRRQEAETVGEVLDILRKRIKDIFVRFGTRDQNGLDIALCAINTKNNIMQYAGAYNPLIIIRDNEIIEHKATRNPIGWYPKEKPFETKEIQLQDNDAIYIFSDGYHDQLGGEKFRKFSSKRFKELLLQIHSLPMQQQEAMLENIINNWRGKTEQVDDIAVMGIRYKAENNEQPIIVNG